MRRFSASIPSRKGSGYQSPGAAPTPSKALLNMRMMSADSLLTILPDTLSQSTGTVTRPVYPGSEAAYSCQRKSAPSSGSGITPGASLKVQPSSAISQCVTETPIIACRPFSSRKMAVRCAQGQARDRYRW